MARPSTLFASSLLIAALGVSSSSPAANIVIVNQDGPSEGFNDPTPASPVGGNPGTTLGQQRLNVFQAAADIWGALLPSDVDVRVAARFNPLSCNASGGVLGSAGPVEVERDFAGAEFPGTWYHVALGNKQAGFDLFPSTDDISTTFNSDIDNNDDCLAGRNFYYGLDGNEGSDIELLPVVLHELGHGLGFSTLVGSDGSEFFGLPDLYETFLFDNTEGLHWDDMSSGQRASSAINSGNVVWDGDAVTFKAPFVLGGNPVMFTNSPPALPSQFTIGTASFGPLPTESGITGDVVLVDDGTGTPTDACEDIVNGAEIAGNIALIDRGSCTFASKAEKAQAVGAIAVIIANNVGTGAIGLGGSSATLTIPTVSISLVDGDLIKSELGNGVNVTITLDPNVTAGLGPNGRVKIYAPNPYEPGSSVSHWDTSALPDLLMEPASTSRLHDDVDLTFEAFEDIGWLDQRVTSSFQPPIARTSLEENHPNPFNPATTIVFNLRADGPVSLAIFDLAGRKVRQLVSESSTAGRHRVEWNGRDDQGALVASGVYLYHLVTDDHEEARRMVLLK